MTSTVKKLAGDFRFTECPRWHDGQLYFVDVHDAKVYRMDSAGTLEPVVTLDHPSGMGWAPNGDLLVISSHACELLRFDGHKLSKAADLGKHGYVLANDMVVDTNGGAYVGGLGEGMALGKLPPAPLLYVSPAGDVRVVAKDLYGPNGMVLTPDGKTLIVAESFAFRLTAFDVSADGSLQRRRVWAQLSDAKPETTMDALNAGSSIMPDGIALDADGAVWLADCRSAGAMRVAEGGRILDRVAFENETVIAVALGGGDRRTLYMMVGPGFARIPAILKGTERLYSVHSATVDVPGAGLP